LAVFFANQSKSMPPGDKVAFYGEATKMQQTIANGALDMLGEPQELTVQYNG
jgi:hypothetical protein